MRKDKLYGWLFHYNPYRNKWEAVHRDHYIELFNGGGHVLRNSSRQALENIIINQIKPTMKIVG